MLPEIKIRNRRYLWTRPIQMRATLPDECIRSFKWFQFRNSHVPLLAFLIICHPTKDISSQSPNAPSDDAAKIHWRFERISILFANKILHIRSLEDQSSNDKNYPYIVTSASSYNVHKQHKVEDMPVNCVLKCLVSVWPDGQKPSSLQYKHSSVVCFSFFRLLPVRPTREARSCRPNRTKRKTLHRKTPTIIVAEAKQNKHRTRRGDWIAAFARVIHGHALAWSASSTDSMPLLILVIRIRRVPHNH